MLIILYLTSLVFGGFILGWIARGYEVDRFRTSLKFDDKLWRYYHNLSNELEKDLKKYKRKRDKKGRFVKQ